ncbi:bifunctional metallophosphatase/5'-nucleotidase [Flammeovirga sp. MY04]|uniref:bifunctional metallophosphatase/5'-nucleotidase n=1 Tax=Flammeovirga sp. MY04 TaxID=1191459 RepID=UPI00080629F2|nr:metallophosphoesterase [Flammeovirga sp. MY04]ANQ48007.1 bifunctional metallophosphatase/5'-nucleotidase [Flammeovirga sp. MY04]
MKTRREFVKILSKSTALSSLGFLMPLESLALPNKPVKLTILHTNDTHSQIDPFPEKHKKYPNMGGVSRRKTFVDKIRAEEDQVLLLDAGDIFQGTPYFNFFKGEIEFKSMSMLKYDAATLGNHDFDNKVDGLSNMLPHAEFPFLIANYDFTNTSMDGKTKPYKIFNKGGIKIGVFGIGIKLDGLVSKACYQETVWSSGIEAAQEYSQKLKHEEKCDLVVCLSHLGYKAYIDGEEDDLHLAEQTKDIDVIIGGHSHTFLDEPTIRKNLDGKDVLITQVGYAGIKVGRLDFYFDNGKKIAYSSDNYDSYPVV